MEEEEHDYEDCPSEESESSIDETGEELDHEYYNEPQDEAGIDEAAGERDETNEDVSEEENQETSGNTASQLGTQGADASVEHLTHSKLQLLHLSVQQSQSNSYAIRSQSVLTTTRPIEFNWACLRCSCILN